MNAQILFSVAAGGAVGAVGRYLTMSAAGHWIGHGFPWGTLVVNILGSALLGVLVEVSALVWSPSEATRAFLAVGLLGSFTTFSAFSLDAYTLIVRGSMLAATGYVLASVFLGIGAFFGAMLLMRQILG